MGGGGKLLTDEGGIREGGTEREKSRWCAQGAERRLDSPDHAACSRDSRTDAECVRASFTCTQRRAWWVRCADGWLILPEFTAAAAWQRRLHRGFSISANQRAQLPIVLSDAAASSSSPHQFALLAEPRIKVSTYSSQPPLKKVQRWAARTLSACVRACVCRSLSPLFLTVLFLPFYISFHKQWKQHRNQNSLQAGIPLTDIDVLVVCVCLFYY